MNAIAVSGDQLRIDYTNESSGSDDGPLDAGSVVIVGAALVGCTTQDIAEDALGSLAVTGVFDIVKDSASDTIAAGAIIYWHATGANTTSSGGIRMGLSVAASANGDEYVRLALNL